MKTFIIRFIIALACCAIFAGIVNGQTPRQYLSDNWKSLSACYLAGTLNSTVEILRHDYDAFLQVFPEADSGYWHPQTSSRNKWKDGDASKGEKFPLSSTLLAWSTDGYHLLRSGEKMIVCAAITFKIGGKKRNWKAYAADFICHSAAYSLGFTTTYSFIFKHGK